MPHQLRGERRFDEYARFPNEKNSPSILSTVEVEGYTMHILDQVLGIPGQCDFEYNYSQIFQFEALTA